MLHHHTRAAESTPDQTIRHDIYLMATDNGNSLLFYNLLRQQRTTERTNRATNTHRDQGLNYWKLDGAYAVRVHRRTRKELFTSHSSGCPAPREILDGQEQDMDKNNYKRTPTNIANKSYKEDLKVMAGLTSAEIKDRITATSSSTETPPTTPKLQLRTVRSTLRSQRQ